MYMHMCMYYTCRDLVIIRAGLSLVVSHLTFYVFLVVVGKLFPSGPCAGAQAPTAERMVPIKGHGGPGHVVETTEPRSPTHARSRSTDDLDYPSPPHAAIATGNTTTSPGGGPPLNVDLQPRPQGPSSSDGLNRGFRLQLEPTSPSRPAPGISAVGNANPDA
jgi:hypothetical protein